MDKIKIKRNISPKGNLFRAKCYNVALNNNTYNNNRQDRLNKTINAQKTRLCHDNFVIVLREDSLVKYYTYASKILSITYY